MLLTIKAFFKRNLTKVKFAAVALVAVIVSVAFILLRRKKDTAIVDLLGKVNAERDAEIAIIEKAHVKEKKEKAVLDKRYAQAVMQINNQHKAEEKTLDRKQKKEVKKIIEETKDDPDLATKKITDLMGFNVYVPKNDD
jgi:hypothetical protein